MWAAGVLLFVMLAGIFPFETQDDNFNNTAGLYDIWLQQIKTSWCALARTLPMLPPYRKYSAACCPAPGFAWEPAHPSYLV